MDCKKVKEQINSILDGFEIKDTDTLLHIKKCKKCQKEYNTVLKIKNTLHTKEKIKIPANFNNMVWSKIGEPRPFVLDFLDKILIPKPVFATAMVIILFLILFGIMFVRNKISDVKEGSFVYNINKEEKIHKSTEKKVTVQKETIVSVEETESKQEIASLDVKGEEQQIKKIEKQKDAQIEYNTYVRLPEDIKLSNVSGEKITSAEVKKEPDKIETTDVRYLREDYKVLNNVINPIKGEKVIIRYKVQNQCPVKIIVYDRNGELVYVLVNENKNNGVYEITWDGKDAKGNITGAGVYFIYLKTDITEKKIKVLVVK